ncbi:response regulator [uncultured Dokdonia sp.]|uniref:response regulator n=1 Tax=uncultured Dokdonia sp. TaxID=575653 RepID=UPI00262BE301|nr:response regulator [uncultured Dokdonia sp.]
MEEKYILIVNQDIIVSSIMQRYLVADTLTFSLAQRFFEVEELLKKQNVDLVITDLIIDGLSTNEYIAFLNKKLPNVPIIVTCHMDHTSIKAEIELLGATTSIPFPLKLSKLKATLKHYL